MDPKIKASFIPDKMPSAEQGGRGAASSGTADVFMLVSVILLAAALTLAAGVFLYNQFLSSSVSNKSEQLSLARASFEPELIDELLKLDARLNAGQVVLAQHIAPSELFRILGSLTLQSVTFENLSFEAIDTNTITIRLDGKAQSVNGVALQASVFGNSKAILNPIFSNLDITNDGVKFHVDAQIDPSLLRYSSVSERYTTQQSSSVNSVTPVQSSTPTDTDAFGDFGATEEVTPANQ